MKRKKRPETLAHAKAHAKRAEALLDYALECWGRQVNALRTAYEAAKKRKL